MYKKDIPIIQIRKISSSSGRVLDNYCDICNQINFSVSTLLGSNYVKLIFN